jgi:hypothetical protein
MGPKPHVGRGPHSAEHVVIAREAARRLAPEHRPQRTFRSGRRDFAYREACKLGYEGIVSKRLGSPYRSGRSPHWVKVKNPKAPAVTREGPKRDWGR